jgi:hypothetical protein
MPLILSPMTMSISSFSSPQAAPRPRVIPLFATTFQRHTRRTLAIHENLPSKVNYHPYSRPTRSATPRTTSPSPSHSNTTPGSPLTPLDNEFPKDASDSPTDPRPILIPPPCAPLTVAGLNWHDALVKQNRVSIVQTLFSYYPLLSVYLAHCKDRDIEKQS